MRVFGHHIHFPMLVLVAVEFLGTAAAFMIGAALAAPAGTLNGDTLWWALAFGGTVVVTVTSVGLYQVKQRLRIEGVLVRLGVGLAFSAVFLALVDFFFPVGVPGAVWAWSFAISLVFLVLARGVFSRFVDSFRRELLVYGAGERAAQVLKLRRASDRRGFHIAAFIPAEGDTRLIDDQRVVHLEGSLLAYAERRGIDEIVIAMDDRRGGFPVAELLECKFAGIAVVDVVDFLERETGKLAVDLVNPSWLIFSTGFRVGIQTRFWARSLDLVAATLLLLLTLPVTLLAAAAILIEDGRPIFYRQQRVGFGRRLFTVLKFRSMIKEAEADGQARWAGRGDSRVTRVGAVLRKLRIDELPQVLNVLRGDMSLVGPRPERPEFVARLAETIPYYHERHVVKPGITGWAQLCYPYGSSDADAMAKLQYDLYYIKHKSLIFDLVVLLQTAEVVLWGKGAR